MTEIPRDDPAAPSADPALNPALTQTRDSTYGENQSGTDPMSTVSVPENHSSAWPMIWAVTVILCVVITIALLIF